MIICRKVQILFKIYIGITIIVQSYLCHRSQRNVKEQYTHIT